MSDTAKNDIVIEPVADAPAVVVATPAPDPGGPIHTHTVTAAGILAIVVGAALIVAAPHLGSSSAYATNTGIGLLVFGTTGATFGKSPAIK
jgi:hypothetical protein